MVFCNDMIRFIRIVPINFMGPVLSEASLRSPSPVLFWEHNHISRYIQTLRQWESYKCVTAESSVLQKKTPGQSTVVLVATSSPEEVQHILGEHTGGRDAGVSNRSSTQRRPCCSAACRRRTITHAPGTVFSDSTPPGANRGRPAP